MLITDLVVTPVAIPLAAPLFHAWGIHPGFGRVILQVVTDEGLVGLGETTLTPNGRQMEEALKSCKPLILGEDPFNRERLRWKVSNPFYGRMFGPALLNAYAAVEFACLDIQGQAIGRPVYDLLGGKMRDRVPVSAYIFYEGQHGMPEPLPWQEADARILDVCAELVEEKGCTAIKFKAGVYPPDQEAETVLHLRERLPAVPIRLDPNSSWTLTTSARIAQRLTDANLEYLEDPVWGLAAMAKLKRLAPWMPLASNMACFGFEDVGPAALLDAVDVVLADPHWYGGLRATQALARVCETFGLDMGMHSGTEFGVSLAAVLHLAATLPSVHHAPDVHYHYLSDDVIQDGPLAYEDGAIAVPEGPGLGVKLDENKLAHYHQVYEWYVEAGSDEPSKERIYTKGRW
jgi:glucarate dehydratase